MVLGFETLNFKCAYSNHENWPWSADYNQQVRAKAETIMNKAAFLGEKAFLLYKKAPFLSKQRQVGCIRWAPPLDVGSTFISWIYIYIYIYIHIHNMHTHTCVLWYVITARQVRARAAQRWKPTLFCWFRVFKHSLSLSIYIYIHTCICIYVYVYMYMCVYMCVYIYIYICMQYVHILFIVLFISLLQFSIIYTYFIGSCGFLGAPC